MPNTLNLRNRDFAIGSYAFELDGLPFAANGFQLAIERDASWLAVGPLFTFTVEISPDAGATYAHWISGSMNGGSASWGSTVLTHARWTAYWPGVVAADGVTRAELKQTNVRLTLNVARDFSTPHVSLQGI